METPIPVFKSKEEVKQILLSDQRYLEMALVALYFQNSEDERKEKKTIGRDKKGFCKTDIQVSCYMAQFICRKRNEFKYEYGQILDGKFLQIARKIVPKYSGQLFQMNQKKAKEKCLI